MRSSKHHLLFLSLILLALSWTSKVKAQDPSFLTNGLIAYFPFNGNAKDESGHGFDGQVVGATLTTNRFGKPDSAYSFQARGSRIRVDRLDSSHFENDFTVSLWVNIDGALKFLPYFVVGEHYFFQMGLWADGVGQDVSKLYGSLLRSSGNWIWFHISNNRMGFDKFHHVVLSRTKGEARLWIDGSLEFRSAVSDENPPRGSYTEIGGTTEDQTFLQNGVIDDVRVYTRGFSESEVSALFEFERSAKARRAKAAGVLVNGFLVEVKVTDPGAGYTNAPKVTISGGGGTGATAFSTINNGSVDRIFILNSGSGFTSPPTLAIEPPSAPPSLSISVATVSVTMSLVEGRKYQLESSKDFQAWQLTGPAFTAEKSEVIKFFEVAETGQYFRLREVQ